MDASRDLDRLASGDSILHAAPLSHGSGLYALAHIASGRSNVIPESGGFEAGKSANSKARIDGIQIQECARGGAARRRGRRAHRRTGSEPGDRAARAHGGS